MSPVAAVTAIPVLQLALMPTGVEHVSPLFAVHSPIALRLALMPAGVEHFSKIAAWFHRHPASTGSDAYGR
jgi:hypothetical protein